MDFFLLPSELARLVLSYLINNNLDKTATVFLSDCSHLQELRNVSWQRIKAFTAVHNLTLQDLVDEYSGLRSAIHQILKDADEQKYSEVWKNNTIELLQTAVDILKAKASPQASFEDDSRSSSPPPSADEPSPAARLETTPPTPVTVSQPVIPSMVTGPVITGVSPVLVATTMANPPVMGGSTTVLQSSVLTPIFNQSVKNKGGRRRSYQSKQRNTSPRPIKPRPGFNIKPADGTSGNTSAVITVTLPPVSVAGPYPSCPQPTAAPPSTETTSNQAHVPATPDSPNKEASSAKVDDKKVEKVMTDDEFLTELLGESIASLANQSVAKVSDISTVVDRGLDDPQLFNNLFDYYEQAISQVDLADDRNIMVDSLLSDVEGSVETNVSKVQSSSVQGTEQQPVSTTGSKDDDIRREDASSRTTSQPSLAKEQPRVDPPMQTNGGQKRVGKSGKPAPTAEGDVSCKNRKSSGPGQAANEVSESGSTTNEIAAGGDASSNTKLPSSTVSVGKKKSETIGGFIGSFSKELESNLSRGGLELELVSGGLDSGSESPGHPYSSDSVSSPRVASTGDNGGKSASETFATKTVTATGDDQQKPSIASSGQKPESCSGQNRTVNKTSGILSKLVKLSTDKSLEDLPVAASKDSQKTDSAPVKPVQPEVQFKGSAKRKRSLDCHRNKISRRLVKADTFSWSNPCLSRSKSKRSSSIDTDVEFNDDEKNRVAAQRQVDKNATSVATDDIEIVYQSSGIEDKTPKPAEPTVLQQTALDKLTRSVLLLSPPSVAAASAKNAGQSTDTNKSDKDSAAQKETTADQDKVKDKDTPADDTIKTEGPSEEPPFMTSVDVSTFNEIVVKKVGVDAPMDVDGGQAQDSIVNSSMVLVPVNNCPFLLQGQPELIQEAPNLGDSASSKVVQKRKKVKKRRRCQVCTGCKAPMCGVCKVCLKNPKFGGKNNNRGSHQCCQARKCLNLLSPPPDSPKDESYGILSPSKFYVIQDGTQATNPRPSLFDNHNGTGTEATNHIRTLTFNSPVKSSAFSYNIPVQGMNLGFAVNPSPSGTISCVMDKCGVQFTDINHLNQHVRQCHPELSDGINTIPPPGSNPNTFSHLTSANVHAQSPVVSTNTEHVFVEVISDQTPIENSVSFANPMQASTPALKPKSISNTREPWDAKMREMLSDIEKDTSHLQMSNKNKKRKATTPKRSGKKKSRSSLKSSPPKPEEDDVSTQGMADGPNSKFISEELLVRHLGEKLLHDLEAMENEGLSSPSGKSQPAPSPAKPNEASMPSLKKASGKGKESPSSEAENDRNLGNVRRNRDDKTASTARQVGSTRVESESVSQPKPSPALNLERAVPSAASEQKSANNSAESGGNNVESTAVTPEAQPPFKPDQQSSSKDMTTPENRLATTTPRKSENSALSMPVHPTEDFKTPMKRGTSSSLASRVPPASPKTPHRHLPTCAALNNITSPSLAYRRKPHTTPNSKAQNDRPIGEAKSPNPLSVLSPLLTDVLQADSPGPSYAPSTSKTANQMDSLETPVLPSPLRNSDDVPVVGSALPATPTRGSSVHSVQYFTPSPASLDGFHSPGAKRSQNATPGLRFLQAEGERLSSQSDDSRSPTHLSSRSSPSLRDAVSPLARLQQRKKASRRNFANAFAEVANSGQDTTGLTPKRLGTKLEDELLGYAFNSRTTEKSDGSGGSGQGLTSTDPDPMFRSTNYAESPTLELNTSFQQFASPRLLMTKNASPNRTSYISPTTLSSSALVLGVNSRRLISSHTDSESDHGLTIALTTDSDRDEQDITASQRITDRKIRSKKSILQDRVPSPSAASKAKADSEAGAKHQQEQTMEKDKDTVSKKSMDAKSAESTDGTSGEAGQMQTKEDLEKEIDLDDTTDSDSESEDDSTDSSDSDSDEESAIAASGNGMGDESRQLQFIESFIEVKRQDKQDKDPRNVGPKSPAKPPRRVNFVTLANKRTSPIKNGNTAFEAAHDANNLEKFITRKQHQGSGSKFPGTRHKRVSGGSVSSVGSSRSRLKAGSGVEAAHSVPEALTTHDRDAASPKSLTESERDLDAMASASPSPLPVSSPFGPTDDPRSNSPLLSSPPPKGQIMRTRSQAKGDGDAGQPILENAPPKTLSNEKPSVKSASHTEEKVQMTGDHAGQQPVGNIVEEVPAIEVRRTRSSSRNKTSNPFNGNCKQQEKSNNASSNSKHSINEGQMNASQGSRSLSGSLKEHPQPSPSQGRESSGANNAKKHPAPAQAGGKKPTANQTDAQSPKKVEQAKKKPTIDKVVIDGVTLEYVRLHSWEFGSHLEQGWKTTC